MSVADTVSDISFETSKNGGCQVVCAEDAKLKHVVTVENGVLTVRQKDERKWMDHVGVFKQTATVTVYMPAGQYEDLNVKTDTGDVTVPEDFGFRTIRIEGDTADVVSLAGASETAEFITDTGDIRIDHVLMGDVTMKTDTGRISLDSVSLFGALKISSHTGNVALTGLSCAAAEIETTTGKVTLTSCLIHGLLDIETDTGDVRLDASDADELEIDTDTGDVTGTLLTEKIFFVESHTGKIDVPRGMSGGACDITTDTGDVRIAIAGQS